MSDRLDLGILGGARRPGPLNDPSPRHRASGLTGPPRGTIVVAEAPKPKRAAKPKATPKVVGRELSVYGTFENQWKRVDDEVTAMAKDRWEPTSDDFAAVAGKSSVRVDSWKGLLQVILTQGDAESGPGSISRINIFTHANSNLIALSGNVRPGNAGADVTLTVSSAISEETLDQLNRGITISVVSKDKKLASRKFVMDDVRKRFTSDAVIVIYACHGAVDTAFVQRIADTFQVKVRAFRDVIGYFPSYEEGDPDTKQAAKVTNRRKVGVGYNSKVKVDDFHMLDSNSADRSPKPLSHAGSANDDDE
jgi:hypothetical protein